MATNFTTQEKEVRNEFEATQGTLQNAIHDMHLQQKISPLSMKVQDFENIKNT
jgi:hypothetical protein